MPTFVTVLDVAALVLTVAYYLLTLVRGTHRIRLLCGNERAYALICEYAPLLFFIGGLLGTLLLTYDRWNGALQRLGLDLAVLAEQLRLRFGMDLLRHTRWALFAVGGWFLVLGGATALLGRREVFVNVRSALHYYVQERQTFSAASYVVTAAAEVHVAETAHPGDLDRWRGVVAVIYQTLGRLDDALRPSWQGANVHLELTWGDHADRPAVTRYVWHFGPHAYLIAELPAPPGGRAGWARSCRGLREFRALVGAIRSLVSVHGR